MQSILTEDKEYRGLESRKDLILHIGRKQAQGQDRGIVMNWLDESERLQDYGYLVQEGFITSTQDMNYGCQQCFYPELTARGKGLYHKIEDEERTSLRHLQDDFD